MKLLLITPYSPSPPHSGGRMRIWNELKYFGARHDVTLVSFYQTAQEWEQQDALRQFCRRVFLVARPTHPGEEDMRQLRTLDKLFDWYTTPEMARVLEPLQAEDFDAVIVHHIFMAAYVKWFRAPVVLEEHNIESEIFRQHAALSERGTDEHTFRQTRWMLLRQYENEMWKQFVLRVVTSEHDREMMRARRVPGKTRVVENGIAANEIAMVTPTATRKVLFMGSLDFFANIDALFYFRETILPLVWGQDATVQVVIAGRRPPDAIRAFAEDARIRVIANPEDMDVIAAEAAVTVVPLRMGSGTRLKILHALALGVPVVTTSKGAEGLAVEDGVHLLVREEPQAFAEAVLEVLDDGELRARLRTAGRARVEGRYDWEGILEGYERALGELVDG